MDEGRNDERSGYVPRGYISVVIDGNEIDVPRYEFGGAYCALFTRLAADLVFDLRYNPCNAWDYPKENRLVAVVENYDDLDRLSSEGVFIEGMIVGFFNPHSGQNRKDRGFTHVGLNLGNGKIAHFYKKTLVEDYKELKSKELSPRVVIAPKK